MGDWIEVLRRRRINDTRPFAWIDVDITQRSILDAMRDEPSLKDAEAIRWIRKGKCIGTTSPQRFGSEIYDGDDVDALLARITELESERDEERHLADVRGEMLTRLESELAARVEPQAEHDRLRWGVVANAGHNSSERMFRWAHVKRNTGFGMTSSIALCREAGFDPDEIVGNEESEEVCDG